MQGEVYVTVEADASTPMAMSAIGSGSLEAGGEGWTPSVSLKWSNPGGITDVNGWQIGFRTIEITDTDDVASINHKIKQAYEALVVPRYYINGLTGSCAKWIS